MLGSRVVPGGRDSRWLGWVMKEQARDFHRNSLELPLRPADIPSRALFGRRSTTKPADVHMYAVRGSILVRRPGVADGE